MYDEKKDINADIKSNIDKILDDIEKTAVKAGRKAGDISLMAVTKTKPVEYAQAAYKAGIRLFGENRATEMADKYRDFYDDAEIHFIGHLQRNKAKIAAENASFVDSIDKYETAEALDNYCCRYGKYLNVLLEYNTSGEENKSGFLDEHSFFNSVDKIRRLENINIKGIMTIAPFTDDTEKIRKSFKMLYNLFSRLKQKHPDLNIDVISMGMSSDYKIAIEEGSTLLRIGTMLFGSR